MSGTTKLSRARFWFRVFGPMLILQLTLNPAARGDFPAGSAGAAGGLGNAIAGNSTKSAGDLQGQSEESKDPGQKAMLMMMALAQMAQAAAAAAAAAGNKKRENQAKAADPVQSPPANSPMPSPSQSQDKAPEMAKAEAPAESPSPSPEPVVETPAPTPEQVAAATPEPEAAIDLALGGEEGPSVPATSVPNTIPRSKLGYDETNPTSAVSGSAPPPGNGGGGGGGRTSIVSTDKGGAGTSSYNNPLEARERFAKNVTTPEAPEGGTGSASGGSSSGSDGDNKEGGIDLTEMMKGLMGPGAEAPAIASAHGDAIGGGGSGGEGSRENIFEHASGWMKRLAADERLRKSGRPTGLSMAPEPRVKLVSMGKNP